MSEEPTTPDLVERVRFMLGDAAIRREFDTILDLFAPDAIWTMPTQEFRGRDAIRRHWEEWYDSYDDFQFGAPDIADLGNGVVLAIVMQGGRLGGSTSHLSQELALIYEWSNGYVVRVTASAGREDVAAARTAAGRLAEERR